MKKNSEIQVLKCGDTILTYENGSLRTIKYCETEILNLVYAAVRDQKWNTIPSVMQNEIVVAGQDEFFIETDQNFKEAEIDFSAKTLIFAEKHKISITFKGRANTSFLKNRIGLCLHIPIPETRGKKLIIGHPGASSSETIFPEVISPHQPAMNISFLEWSPSENIKTKITFRGEVFEMEDQRNWTDASYKLYGTPLAEKYPMIIDKGSEVHQVVVVELEGGDVRAKHGGDKKSIRFEINGKRKAMPEIGVSRSSQTKLEKRYAEKICGIRYSHYSAEIRMFDENWKDRIISARKEAALLNSVLELRLIFSWNFRQELEQFLNDQPAQVSRIRRIILFGQNHLSNESLLVYALPKIREVLPDTEVGGGTNAHFAELNRNRIKSKNLDFVCYSVCPQVHVTDDDPVMENAGAQKDTVESAKAIFNLPVCIHAISLKQRFNAVSTSEDGSFPQKDLRQKELYAALWSFKSILALIESGTHSFNLFETVGDYGIIGSYSNGRAEYFPVYYLLKEFLFEIGLQYSIIRFEQKTKLAGISVYGNKTKLFLANYSKAVHEICEPLSSPIKHLKILKKEGFVDLDIHQSKEMRPSTFRIRPLELILIEF